MKHIWNQPSFTNGDFETIEKGKGIFKSPLELHLDVNYQGIIIKSTIKKCLIVNQPESDARNDPIGIIKAKLN